MTTHRKGLVLAWAPVLLWMLLIFALSAIPEMPGDPGLPHAGSEWIDHLLRNAAHMAEYAVLAGLVWRAARLRVPPSPGYLGPAAWSLLYAASDELHQAFVPGRTCSLQDWALDAAGAGLGLVLLVARRAYRQRQANPTR